VLSSNTSTETKFEIRISKSETNFETNKSQIGKIQNIESKGSWLGVLHILVLVIFDIVSNFGSFDVAQDRFGAPKFFFLAPFPTMRETIHRALIFAFAYFAVSFLLLIACGIAALK
jgi:hypothetical protein